ncbi:hypothetical protein PT974_02018 [Cladobotryum mycophilum]|uniref:Uncharacterized protein n=1 Tax=Cladobotryum mycophilum TaxID=491253 RepID=A0ABR0SX12_9HYPO
MSSQEHVATNTTTTTVAVSITYPAAMAPPGTAPVFNIGQITISVVPPVAAVEQQPPADQDEQQAPPAAAQGETFPALPLTPIHSNQIVGESAPEGVYELPGTDHFPLMAGSRGDNSRWLAGPFDRLNVGGRTFVVPTRLLQRYPFWRVLRTMRRPAEGWSLPNEDPNIFAIVLECVYSPSGFDGTESHINLVKLMLAIVMVKRWDMSAEFHKLEASVRRYIVRRVLFRNPFLPDPNHVMDHNYFVYRSEEIYRTWKLCKRFHTLNHIVSSSELISLYATTIPHDMWPALTTNFDGEFTSVMDVTASIRQFPAEDSFEDWWFRFFRMAGYLDYDWFDPLVMERYFLQNDDEHPVPEHTREEFEAARARGNALVDTYDARQEDAIRMLFDHPHIIRDSILDAVHATAEVPYGTPITPQRSPQVQSANEPEVVEIP